MTCPAPRVKSYLHPLDHHRIKQQRNLRPGRQPSGMPWSSASPPPCPGKTRCRRMRNSKGVVPLWKAAPNPGSPPPLLEGDNTSDVSMEDDILLQQDSDMVVKEEREESMDMDVPASPAAPAPLKEKSMSEDLEAGDPNDH